MSKRLYFIIDKLNRIYVYISIKYSMVSICVQYVVSLLSVVYVSFVFIVCMSSEQARIYVRIYGSKMQKLNLIKTSNRIYIYLYRYRNKPKKMPWFCYLSCWFTITLTKEQHIFREWTIIGKWWNRWWKKNIWKACKIDNCLKLSY